MATKDPENDEVHKNTEINMIDRDRELSQKWKCKELISSSLWKKDKQSTSRKVKELNGNADVKKVTHSNPIGIDLNYWRRSRSRLRLCSNGKDFLELLSLHKSRSRSIDMRSRDAFSQLKWNNNHMNNLYSRCIQNQTIQTNHAQIWKGVERAPVPVPVPVDPSSPGRVRVQVKNNNNSSKGGSQLKKKNKVKTKAKTKEEVEQKTSALSQDVGVEAHPCNSICGIRRSQQFKPSCSKIMEIWKYAEQVDNWTSTKGQKQTQTCRVNNVSRGTRTNSVIAPLAASLTFQSVKIPKIYDPYNKNILFRQLYEEQTKAQTLPQETTPKIAPKSDAGMTPSLNNSNIMEEVKVQPTNPSSVPTPTQREKLMKYDYDYNPFETPKKSYASKSDVITSDRDEYYLSDIMDDYDYTDSDDENQADDPGSGQTHIDLLLRLPKKEFLEEIQHLEEEDLKFSVVADDVSFAPVPVRGWTSFPELHDRFNPSNKQHLSPHPTMSTLTSTSTSTMTDDQLWRTWAEDQLHVTKALALSYNQHQQPISSSRMFNRQNRLGKALPRQFQLLSDFSNSKLTPDPDTIARVNINVNESVSACAQAQASTDYWNSYNHRDTDDTDLTDCSVDTSNRFKPQENPEDFTDLMSSCKTGNRYNSCSSNHSSENNNEDKDNPDTMFTKDEDDLRLLSGSGFGQIPGLGPDFGFGENQNVYEVMKRSRSKQRGDEPKSKPKNRSKSKSRTRALSCDSLISISNSSRSQSSSTEHLHKISPAFNLHLLRPAQHQSHHHHHHQHGQEGSKEAQARTAANSKREQDESQKNQQYSSNNAFLQRPPRRSKSRSQKRKRSRTRNSHIGFAIGSVGRENSSRLNLQPNVRNSETNQIRSGLTNSGIDEEVELGESKILSVERDNKAQKTEETEKRGKLSHSSNNWTTEAELNEEVSNCVEENSEENSTANLTTPHECDSIFGLMKMQEELNRLNTEKYHFRKSQSSRHDNGFLPTTILDLKELATLWNLAHDTQDRGCDPVSDPDLDHDTPSLVLEDQSIMSKFKSKKSRRRPENFMRRSPKYFPWGFSKIANGRKGQQSQFQGQGQGQEKTPPPVPPLGAMLSLKRCMAQWFDKRCHFA